MAEMKAEMTIADVLMACDTDESDYRIVELSDGRFAFTWGMQSSTGDVIPWERVHRPLAEHGAEVFASYEAAEESYRQCAEALQQTGELSGDEMLASI